MPLRHTLTRRLHGPHIALPAALDACSERWWRLPPRARVAVVVVAVLALVGATQARVLQVRASWGGPPQRVLVAVRAAAVGEHPQVRATRVPPALAPPGAPAHLAADARLAFALPAGTVLTRDHLSARGPAAGLPPDLRVVPMPVDPGWDVRAGGWVDVWTLTATGASERIAEHRPVLAVVADDDPPSALVGLATGEVAAAMRGLAGGQVLLTHAPP